MIIYDNILNVDTCNSLINDFEKNNDYHIKYRDTFILPLQNNENKFISKLSYIYTSYLNSKSLLYVPEKIEIVKWPENSEQPVHKDNVRSSTKLTTITYQNDDFIGTGTLNTNGTTDTNFQAKYLGATSTTGSAHETWIGELGLYNKVLSRTEITNLITYLKSRWIG